MKARFIFILTAVAVLSIAAATEWKVFRDVGEGHARIVESDSGNPVSDVLPDHNRSSVNVQGIVDAHNNDIKALDRSRKLTYVATILTHQPNDRDTDATQIHLIEESIQRNLNAEVFDGAFVVEDVKLFSPLKRIPGVQ